MRWTMDGRGALVVAFDHAPLGLQRGLEDISRKVRDLLPQQPDGVILNCGVLKHLGSDFRAFGQTAAIARLDGNRTHLGGDWTASPDWELFFSAATAKRFGASAAIVNLLLGGP